MRRISYLAAAVLLMGLLTMPQIAQAQAVDQFLGQLMLVAFNFCPVGWLPANGQFLSIAQNQALFALLGTTYGGNGQSNFALPNLQGRVPISLGQGPGLSAYTEGQTGGAETHTLSIGELPAHTHQAYGSNATASVLSPAGAEVATQDRVRVYTAPGAEVAMSANAIGATGGNQPFSIQQPFLTLQWCIAINGVFPSRN